MIRPITLPALLLCSVASAAWADKTLDFSDETTRINYSLGYQIGGDFKQQKVEMNADAVVQGINDALAGGEPKMSRPEMLQTLRDLKQKVEDTQKEQMRLRENALIEAGKKFMAENATKEGVVTTDSGLQYKVLEEGSGESPGPTDKVTVNYKGFLIDGREFDSSFKRGKPATFQVNGVIKGWTEGLQLMKEGGKMMLFIPPSLAYNRSGPLEHQTLIFEMELLSVGEPHSKPSEAETKSEPVTTNEAGADNEPAATSAAGDNSEPEPTSKAEPATTE